MNSLFTKLIIIINAVSIEARIFSFTLNVEFILPFEVNVLMYEIVKDYMYYQVSTFTVERLNVSCFIK